MFTNRWLLLLLLGLSFSLVISHDGHSEDEHDEEDMAEDGNGTDSDDEDGDDSEDDGKDSKDEDNTEDEEAPDADADTSEGHEPDDDDQTHLEHDAFLGENSLVCWADICSRAYRKSIFQNKNLTRSMKGIVLCSSKMALYLLLH